MPAGKAYQGVAPISRPMVSQRKAATPEKGAKKSAAKAPRKAPARGADTGADMPDEAPGRETHGDARPTPKGSRAAQVREALRHDAKAEHEHRDPRWTEPKMDGKLAKAHHDPRKEGGISKDRQARRMGGMVNWFRKAPKSKGE